MSELSREASIDKNQFIINGHLDMDRVLERFVVHYNDIYGVQDEKFLEKEGRRLFLLYIKPIINGTGNYYVESETRDETRTDLIIDYRGEQFVIEMKV